MEQLSTQIAQLVRERQRRGITVEQLAETEDLDVEILLIVERAGVGAPLGHIHVYAQALGFDLGLAVVAGEQHTRRIERRCDMCGGSATHHKQVHLELLGHCVDERLAPLIAALHSCGIKVTGGCEGFLDGRRGGEAHIVLPTLADSRALYALVDRAGGELPSRAGLRGYHAGGGSWSSAVRWDVLPGELLADATCVVRFPSSDIEPLVELAANPPRPALSELAYRQR